MSAWFANLSTWLEGNPEWLGLAIFLVACLECLAVAGIPMQGMSISAAGPHFGAYLAFSNADDASKAVQVLANLDA